MRRIAAATLLVLSACGSAAPASSVPGAVPAPRTSPPGHAGVITSADGIHISTLSESRTVTHDIGAPVDRVWQVLPDVYRELGITATADADQRTVASPSLSFDRRMFGEPATRFFDCGRGQFGTEIASSHTIFVTLRTTVQPGVAAGLTRLESEAQAYARNNDGGANATMAQCHSKGLLEGLIALRVREKLGASAPGR